LQASRSSTRCAETNAPFDQQGLVALFSFPPRTGRFREDLYFRLNVIPIRIPALRERREDIPSLVQHFAERFARELGVSRRWSTEAALTRLQSHRWPGNVRELENVIKRALVMASGDVITHEDIELAQDAARPSRSAEWPDLVRSELVEMLDAPEAPPGRGPYWYFVERLERSVIEEAMRRSGGNQIQAARLLGINRNTLRKKIVDLGIGVGRSSASGN
jgi:two-component system nitrogen regulation response regulator GlnG